jgi:hypothetical protein
MKDAITIDSVASNRSALNHQLTSIGLELRSQYSSIDEAKGKIPENFKGIIFISIGEGLPAVSDFTSNFRVRNTTNPVIAIGSTVTIEEMRALISLGIDQVLIRPFNSNQLKDKVDAAINFRAQVQKEDLLKPPPIKAKFETSVDAYTDKFYKISITGWLSEGCDLPNLKIPNNEGVLFLDCDQLWGMNSIGIRLWSLWIKSLTQGGFHRFEFENFRSSILQTISIFKNLLPPNSAVNSFYLRYWNEELEKEIEIRLTRGQHFSTDRMTIPKTFTYKVDGQDKVFELDEFFEKLLFFYPGKIEVA